MRNTIIVCYSSYDKLVELVVNRGQGKSYEEYSNATIVQDEEHIKAHKKLLFLIQNVLINSFIYKSFDCQECRYKIHS